MRASQLDTLIGTSHARARAARHAVEHLDAYLSATQLGITLASLGLGWVGEPFLAQMIEPFFALAGVTAPALIHGVSFAGAFAVITVLHIVLGELAPKSLAIRRPVPTTLWTSGPLRWFYLAFRPAIWVLNGLANWLLRHLFHLEPVGDGEHVHSPEELRLLVMESGDTGAISPVSQEIVTNAFDLRGRTVREVMTPRVEVVFLDAGLPFAENLARAKASRHTRFPLCEGDLDHAFGLVHIKDLLAQLDTSEPSVRTIRRELTVVPETMALERLLATVRKRRSHLAVVLDEFGGGVGIVTLQHVVDEIVGELPDEFDDGLNGGAAAAAEPEFRQTAEGEFLVAGSLGLYELRDLAGLDWHSGEVVSIGGFVTERLGHLPQRGEELTLNGYRVTVAEADGRRVRQLHLKRLTPAAAVGGEVR